MQQRERVLYRQKERMVNLLEANNIEIAKAMTISHKDNDMKLYGYHRKSANVGI